MNAVGFCRRVINSRGKRRQFLHQLGSGLCCFTAANLVRAFGGESTKQIGGVFPIGFSPFTDDNRLDLDGLAAQVRFCNRGSVHGFVWPQIASAWTTLYGLGTLVVVRAVHLSSWPGPYGFSLTAFLAASQWATAVLTRAFSDVSRCFAAFLSVRRVASDSITQVSFALGSRMSTSGAAARFTWPTASITISLRSPRYCVMLRRGLLRPSSRRTANLIVFGRASSTEGRRAFFALEPLLVSSRRIVFSERAISF